MLRKISIACAVLALVLTGCDKPKDNEQEVHMAMPVPTNARPAEGDTLHAPPPPFVPPPDIMIGGALNHNALFSLRHDLTVAMAHDAVAVRFQAAREACLKEQALHCILTSASITVEKRTTAQLQVALPHDQVAVFERRLMKALPQDGGDKAEITSRSTSTENETANAADVERQLAQAVAYRDKLEQLSKRENLSVEEVLKIHEALGEAQTAVENATAAKRASDSNIRLEHVNITLEEKIVPVQTSAFDGFWKNAGDVFMASLAQMLLHVVNALPWLPLALVVAWLAARFLQRRQRRNHSA